MSDRPEVIQLTREQLGDIVESAVDQALLKLGVDTKDAIAVQQDMAYLRDLRTASDALKKKALLTLAGILVAGICTALWIGFKDMLTKGG